MPDTHPYDAPTIGDLLSQLAHLGEGVNLQPLPGVTPDPPFPHLARDANGDAHLLIPTGEDHQLDEDGGSSGIGLSTRQWDLAGRSHPCVDLHCTLTHLQTEFSTLLVMVLDELQTGRDPLESCRHVLARFRELLRLRHQASVDTAKAAGLFAELLWMSRVAGHSPHAALGCWRGDSGGTHDFATTDHAVEVKATLARETLNIPISSIDQLEPPRGGTLHLYVVRLDTEPDPDALSVPELIDRLTSEGVDRTDLLDRLAESTLYHYLDIDRGRWEAEQFTVADEYLFRVDDDFPKLTHSELTSDLSDRVVDIDYEVDLLDLDGHMVQADEYDQTAALLLG